MLNCIIIEDQPPAQRILKKYIGEIDFLELKAIFSDVYKAKEYMASNHIELIFLDIHLPKISGIDFLKSEPNLPNIILTTAFSDYALESYDFNVIDYLLKPIPFDRFLKAISKLEGIMPQKPDPFTKTVFIKSGYAHLKLNINDILYIKADSDYTEIFTEHKTHLSKESLKYWLQKLQNINFCRIHKSYLLNTVHLTKVSANQVYLGEISLPIGRAYKKHFMDNYLS